jgi:hypothetical protein
MTRHFEALESDPGSVNDQPTMHAWLTANERTYMAADFPIAARIRAMKVPAARRMLLGIASSADGPG